MEEYVQERDKFLENDDKSIRYELSKLAVGSGVSLYDTIA